MFSRPKIDLRYEYFIYICVEDKVLFSHLYKKKFGLIKCTI